MTATYEKLGLKFLYPETWKLIDEWDSELPSSISLETPDGGGFWSVHLHSVDADQDEVLKETLVALQDTYPDLEINPIDVEIEGFSGVGLETMFYCLDFLVRVKLQVVATRSYQMLFWFQAEDREFGKLELVFKAIATSVLSES